MDALKEVFLLEARENLVEMESALLELESSPDDRDTINRAFRAAHTIKGSAGMAECDAIAAFTHDVENLLDRMRDGDVFADPELITALLGCTDHLEQLLNLLADGIVEPDTDTLAAGRVYLDKLLPWMGGEEGKGEGGRGNVGWPSGQQVGRPQVAPTPDPRPEGLAKLNGKEEGGGLKDADARAGTDCWHISVRFGRDTLRNGNDPMDFLIALRQMGEVVHLETRFDGMPDAHQMDAESSYIGFEITLKSDADKAAIEAVFAFVRDDSQLTLLPPKSRVEDYVALINSLPDSDEPLGELLVKTGVLTRAELDRGLSEQESIDADGDAPHPQLGDILVNAGAAPAEVVEAAIARQAKDRGSKGAGSESRVIRVPAEKLDRMIDLVGELVIASAASQVLAQQTGHETLVESLSVLARLVEDMRESSMQLRMVQIGETFARFQRVVRDLSRDIGKEIDLVTQGGETELDKSVVEKIGDPLMHLVRNSIDHGVEPPEARAAAGKPRRGRITLNAYHESGSVVIEVRDDGRGLNREKILAKAVERGLVAANASLTDAEIHNLIFEAGFSTADKVTEISGRGVGMDVVRRNIQALRGTVTVASTPGAGSVFTIRLPLTLAIIDGFRVGIGEAHFVLPLDVVSECLKHEGTTASACDYINLRGELLPFVRLSELFEEKPAQAGRGVAENIVVVQYAGQRVGVVVERLYGEMQTVIKPLGRMFQGIKGLAGSTLLGGGEIALILDVPALVEEAARRQTHHALH